MSPINNSRTQTAFTISIEAKEGVTTGISAADRAHTISVAINHNRKKEDIVSPGHIFPLMAWDGGVLERAGHTEASIDIAKLSKKIPAAVICEIMNDDGTMARGKQLFNFTEKILSDNSMLLVFFPSILITCSFISFYLSLFFHFLSPEIFFQADYKPGVYQEWK